MRDLRRRFPPLSRPNTSSLRVRGLELNSGDSLPPKTRGASLYVHECSQAHDRLMDRLISMMT